MASLRQNLSYFSFFLFAGLSRVIDHACRLKDTWYNQANQISVRCTPFASHIEDIRVDSSYYSRVQIFVKFSRKYCRGTISNRFFVAFSFWDSLYTWNDLTRHSLTNPKCTDTLIKTRNIFFLILFEKIFVRNLLKFKVISYD